MCGICGFFNLTDRGYVRPLIETMTSSLDHRGPDGKAVWAQEERGIGLGHTRLSIIDLALGAQPMVSADGQRVIVFNGEIYNFKALRAQLEGLGRSFRTNSDTEVLLEAYAQWGPACLERIQGMFALALYDLRANELFLARDRTGIKPLYVHAGPTGFYFGSELKALLSVREVPRRLNYQALSDFFVFKYPLLPSTFFRDIQELEPGTWLKVSDQRIVTGCFWRWERTPADWDEPTALERTHDAILQSLEAHLVSDVPIGAFLSGGIDSSLLVALLVKEVGRDIETFNVRFEEADYDESPYARRVAEYLGTRHHEIAVRRGAADISLVERILQQFDQPFGDSSAIPTYLICREIRDHVKVAIAGDGGDEMFGGYERFAYADMAKRIGHLPQWLRAGCRQAAGILQYVAPDRARQGRKLLRSAECRDERRMLVLCSYALPEEFADLLETEVLNSVDGYIPALAKNGQAVTDPGGAELIDATIRYELPGDYLRKVDVMSSAHGLEVRVPLLGEQVLECAARVPNEFRYSRERNKILLRALAGRLLPPEIAQKPKAGFGIPLDTWLGKAGREEVRSALCSPQAHIRGILRPDAVASLTSGFVTGSWDHARSSRYKLYEQVYLIWSLERWLARWNPSL